MTQTEPLFLAGLLGLGVSLAAVRLLLWQRSAPPADRSSRWRLALLLVLQPLAAVLLYLTLLPPPLPGTAGTLVVATAAAPPFAGLAAGDTLIALPEAPDRPGAVRVPDLATALRRNPGVAGLRIVGHGLVPRDRAAAAGLAIAFDPALPPPGLAALALPRAVAPGAAFRIGGTASAARTAELLDPAGQIVDTAVIPPSGHFVLAGSARIAGPADFTLRLRDARARLIETTPVPILAATAPAPRLLIIAGAAGPDLKYLRRWASDAGIVLATSIAAGAGLDIGDSPPRLDIGDSPPRLDAARLARLDLLVLDERSWASLPGGQRATVLSAIRSGLGVVLRVTGPVPSAVRGQWAALGLPIGDALLPLRLPPPRQPPASARDTPELTRLRLTTPPATTVTLWGEAGSATAVWRGIGRGRIGIWPVTDLYALVLAGQPNRHAAIWSQIFATLARPDARPDARAAPTIPAQARPDQRLSLCNLSFPASVLQPDGATTALIPDPATPGCAAFWPRRSGWHRLRHGTASHPFPVAIPGPGLAATETRTATWRLQAPPRPRRAPPRPALTPMRGPSWPWFVAFATVSALLWWFERARHTPTPPKENRP